MGAPDLQGMVLLDRYEVKEQIGAGGMGVVYRALDRVTGSIVAAKVMASAGNDAQEHRLRREYRALQRVRHPNVVQVMGWGSHEERFFYVMEYVSGVTLREFLPRPDAALGASCRESVDLFLMTVVTALGALDAVHAAGIVHRDIKPHNIMVDASGVVKLMDFGLVQSSDASQTETESGSVLGTVAYMAPEQVRGQRVDRRADLYSIGVILYEYLTSRRPFVADTAIAVLTKIVSERPTPPRLLCGWISPALEDIVLRLLSKNPEDRLASALEVAEAIRGVTVSGSWLDPAEQSWASGAFLPPRPSSRLVGRDDLMERLRGAADRMLRGRGQMVMVSGEAGAGKSRLVQELCAGLPGETMVLRGGCYENEGLFYQPFLAALSDYRRMAGIEAGPRAKVDLASGLRASFRDLDPESIGEPAEGWERNPQDFAKGGKDEPRTAPAATRDELVEQMKLFDLAARFFSRLGRQAPVVLAIEDLQWSDELTLELLRFLARNLKPERVLTVVTCRTEDRTAATLHPSLHGFQQTLAREGLCDLEVRVGRLERDAVAELACSILGRESIPDGLADAIFRNSDGNAYFVEEIAKAVLESTAPEKVAARRETDRWRRGVFDLPLPKSASDLVERQLGRVGEDARRLLTIAALCGREFPFDLLMSLSGGTEEDLLEHIDVLIRQGLIEEVPGRDLDTYRFVHGMTRSVLERDVNRRKARRLHSAIASAMEDLYHDRFEDKLDLVVEEIARHAFLAREHQKALLYSLAAGQKASASYAHETAIRHLEMAYEAYGESPDLLSPEQATALTLHLGEAYERTGKLQQAREVYEELLADLKGHPALGSDLALAAASTLESMGNLTAAMEMLDGAQELAGQDEERLLAILGKRGDLWSLRGDGNLALELYLEALARAEARKNREETILAMERVARVFLQNGEPREAGKYLERAISEARASDDKARLAELLAAEAQVHHDLYDGTAEMAALEECLEVRKALGDQLGTVVPMGSLGRAYVRQGDLERGVSFIEESLRRSRRYGVLHNEALRLRDLATVATYRGEHEAALAQLSQALDVCQRVRHAPATFAVSADLALARARLSKIEQARQAAAAARALAMDKRNVFWLLRAESVRAEILLIHAAASPEAREEAEAALSEAERIASGVAELLPRPHFAHLGILRARYLQAKGDLDGARAQAEAALHDVAGAPLPHLRARAAHLVGTLAAIAGDVHAARPALEEARDTYRRLGDRGSLERVEQALQELLLGRSQEDP